MWLVKFWNMSFVEQREIEAFDLQTLVNAISAAGISSWVISIERVG